MSVDAEIEEVRQTINEIHRALYKIDAHLNGAVENVQRELTYFDQRLQSIAAEASRISTQVIQTVSTFPNQQIYLAIIMILDVLIWLVVGMLIYKAILAWRHRYVISERFMQKALGYPKKVLVNSSNKHDCAVYKQLPPDSPPKYELMPIGGLLPMYSRTGTKGLYETTYGIDR